MMKTNKIFLLFLISGFLYVSCTEKVTSETGNEDAGGDAVSKTDSKSASASTAGYSSDLPRTTVEATGSAKTRDGALVDACRLAVAQVHGGLISGSLLKTNEVRGDLVIGSTFEETRDSSTLSFGGLLLNYKVISQTEPTSEGGVWKISITADVLTKVPDRFSGRVSVVTPSVDAIARELGGGDMELAMAEKIALSIDAWFANDKHFVLLERNSESMINNELSRAASGSSAVKEKSKIGAEKVADMVIIIEGGKIDFAERSTKFELAGEVHRCQARTSMIIKAVDVATKGEVGRSSLNMESSLKSSRDRMAARADAVRELNDKLVSILPLSELEIMSSLGLTRCRVDVDGAVTILSPSRSIDLSKLREIQLRDTSVGNPDESGSGVIGSFKIDTAKMMLDIQTTNAQFDSAKIYAFTPILNTK